MSDTISVRVSTGEIILVEIDHLKKYPTSPLSTHALEFQQDVYVLEDVDYSVFQQIHDVMTRKLVTVICSQANIS